MCESFQFGGVGLPLLILEMEPQSRGVARPLNNKSDICGHLSKGKDIDGIAKGNIAIRILLLMWSITSGNITMWNITSGNITMWNITSGNVIPISIFGKFGHHASK